ncbi:MAG: hypothetical protein ICV60_17975 [Pyrinomonadaceae bacterium]|nr:hypothetical protein [Pyrinomonadaceae bacterium]
MERAGVLNIESVGSANVEPHQRVSFLRRQLQPQESVKRTVFDVTFGIALPILCFIFDPIVFRSFFGGEPFLGKLQFLAYTIALIEISTLALWLSAGKLLREHALAIGGFLYAGALVSFLIGVVLFPLSLLGIMFFGIGLFGFIPFLTALVFWRNGRRAVNLHQEGASRRRKLAAFALGLTFVLGFPLAMHLRLRSLAHESLQKILTGDGPEGEAATEQLKLLDSIIYTDTDEIIRAYYNERAPVRRERLARAYMRITGRSIDAQRSFMFD